MIHIGKQPTGDTTESNRAGYELVEEKPLGAVKYWHKRELSSGCGKKINVGPLVQGCLHNGEQLWYCPHCKEYFSKAEFINE